MENFNLKKENIGKVVAFFAIVISAAMIFEWRAYEKRVLKEALQAPTVNAEIYIEPSPERAAGITLLEKMAMA